MHVTAKTCRRVESSARELGVIDDIGIDGNAELTVVAPASALEAEVTNALEQTTGIVTDTRSVKTAVSQTFNCALFGPSMAGSEQEVDGADQEF